MIQSQTEQRGLPKQVVRVGAHTLYADLGAADGGADGAPGPHEYFDASLATCKALTAHWVARRKGYPLEEVHVGVERDASEERAGTYRLRVKLAFLGPLSEEQRSALYQAVARCPVHKLMTTTDVVIETEPL